MSQKKSTPSVWPMGLGYFFVFMVFHAVERHITAYFSGSDQLLTGLIVLSLGYFTLIIGDALSPMVIGKWGCKKALMVSTAFYLLLTLAIASGNNYLIFPVVVLVGLMSALMWNGMGIWITKSMPSEKVGEGFGITLALYGFGAGIGLVATSALLTQFNFQTTFLILAPITIIAMIFFSRLTKVDSPESSAGDIVETFKNPTVLRLATISGTAFVIFGLLVTAVPLQIQATLGKVHIGWISSVAFFTLGTCWVFGRQIDAMGRTKLVKLAYPMALIGLFCLLWARSDFMIMSGAALLCIAFAILFTLMFTMADLAPTHKVEEVFAVLTAADDIAIFAMMVISAIVTLMQWPMYIMYIVAAAFLSFSFWVIMPFINEGHDMHEARKRLADAFPEE